MYSSVAKFMLIMHHVVIAFMIIILGLKVVLPIWADEILRERECEI